MGETILAKIPGEVTTGRTVQKLADRWRRGIWLGKTDESDEHLVAVDGQVGRYRTVRRLLEGRWCGEELKRLRATPRTPHPGTEEEGGSVEGGHPMASMAPGGAGPHGERPEEATRGGQPSEVEEHPVGHGVQPGSHPRATGLPGAEPWKRASDQEKAPEETKGPKAGRDHHNKERRKDTNNNHPHDNRRKGYETTRLQCQ